MPDNLDEIVRVASKEVKDEKENIRQISLTILSANTENPQNTRIIAPAGEGKTYLVKHTSKFFPQEKIIILAKATPESFKYMANKKVIEVEPEDFQDYDLVMTRLKEKLEKTKDSNEKKKIQKKIKELEEKIYYLWDFEGTCLIFLDGHILERLWCCFC